MEKKLNNLKVFAISKDDPHNPNSYLIHFSYTRRPPAISSFICVKRINLTALTNLVRSHANSSDYEVLGLCPYRPDMCFLKLNSFPGSVFILPEELYTHSEFYTEESDSPMQFINCIVDEFSEDILYRGEAKAFWHGQLTLKQLGYENKPIIERYSTGVNNVIPLPLPKIFRTYLANQSNFLEPESTYIRSYQHHFYEPSFNSNFEWLSDMQHYGMPTRLLDVTSNPLTALYFACNDHFKPYHPARKNKEGPYDEGDNGAIFLYNIKKEPASPPIPFVLENFIKSFWCDLAAEDNIQAFPNFLEDKLKDYIDISKRFIGPASSSRLSEEDKINKIKEWLNQKHDEHFNYFFKSLISHLDSFYIMLWNLYDNSPLHVIPPPYLNSRISNQCGSFLIFPGKKFHGNEFMQVKEAIQQRPIIIFVPVEWKRKILQLLHNQFNIHEGSIYPDKEHIVRSILRGY